MEIRRIEICNINSLQDEWVLDFEKGALATQDIFAIVGETGSGKSTILDAITLALYNKVPRLDGKKGSGDSKSKDPYKRLDPKDTANCLTRGQKKGYVKLFFECNGEVYMAGWFCQLDRVKFNGERKLLMRSVLEDGTEKWDEVIPAHNLLEDEFSARSGVTVAKEIQKIMGLGYEQYCKACILAQNSFATFLKADDETKTDLLEKLTGTGIYKIIASVITEKKSEADRVLSEINNEIAPYRGNIKDDIKEIKAEKSRLETESGTLTAARDGYVKNLTWNKEKRDADEAVRLATEALKEAKEAALGFEEDRKRLSEHDSTAKGVQHVNDVSSRNSELASAKDRLKEAESNRQTNNDNIKQKIEEKIAKEAEKTEADKAYDLVKQDKALVENWTNIAQHYNNLNHRIADIRKEATKYPEWVIEGQTESSIVDTAAGMVKTVPEDADAQSLSAAVSLADKKIRACDDAKALHDNLKQIAGLEGKNREIDAELIKLAPVFSQQKADEKKWEDQVTALTLSDYVKVRGTLEEGAPCPLCGGTHHPYSGLEGQASKALEEALALATCNRDEAKGIREATEEKINGLKSQHTGNESAARELRKLHSTLRNSISASFPSLKGQLDDDNADILDDLSSVFESREEQVAMKAAAELNVKLFDLKLAVDSYIDSRDTLDGYLHEGWVADRDTDQKGQQDGLLKRMQKYNDAKKKVDDIIIAIGTIDTEKGVYDKEVASMQKKVEDAEHEVREKTEALAAAEAERDRWITDYNSVDGNAITLDKLVEIAGDETDWTEVRKRISDAEAAVNTAKGSLKTSNDNVGKLDKDSRKSELSDDELNILISGIDTRLDGDTDNIGIRKSLESISNVITLHEQAEAKFEGTKDSLAAANHQCELWNRFYGMLESRAGGGKEGKEFRRLAQNYTLSLLIKYANEQLDKFNKRYTLKKQNDYSLEIMVVDKWKGGDERYASSLSGGETFVISLSLALALSKISSGAVTLTNLFIDEGFGTLDAGYQKTVIAALHGLKAEGKKVGVISHTSALLEDDDIFKIRVIKQGITGKSTIEFKTL